MRRAKGPSINDIVSEVFMDKDCNGNYSLQFGCTKKLWMNKNTVLYWPLLLDISATWILDIVSCWQKQIFTTLIYRF